MGRKLKGAALRAHKRGKEYASDMVDQKATQVERQAVVDQSNEELFVLDTTGDNKAVVPPQLKQLPTKKETAKKKKGKAKSSLTMLDEQRVEALVQKHDAKKLRGMVKDGQAKMSGDRRRVSQRQQRKKGKFDLWGADNDDNDKPANSNSSNNSNNKKKKVVTPSAKQDIKDANAKAHDLLQIGGIKGEHASLVAERVVSQKANDGAVAVDVAHAGQSYRPDPHHYAAAVQDAVSVELRRQQAQAHAKAPLANGMSAETLALLVGDSSDEEEDNEDGDEDMDGDEQQQQQDDNGNDALVLRKRRGKLTRAERNKQKRVRSEKVVQDAQKQKKKLENSVAEIPRFKKEIKKHTKELQEKKEKLEEEKEKNKTTPGRNVLQRISKRDPIHAPTIPVALEAEHKDSSLRTIIPKGSLVTDRMASFVDRNLVSKRKFGDKKRVMQGKRRKLNIKGKGNAMIQMDHKMMG